MVNAEIQTPVVERNQRSESDFGIYASETGLVKFVDGITARNVVEVAREYYVGPSVESYIPHKLLSLICTVDSSL